MHATIVLLPGDGIGPEVTGAAERVLRAVAGRFGHSFTLTSHCIGGAALHAGQQPLPDETREACLAADAVLLGAVGDSAFDMGSSERRPETALLQLRQVLGGSRTCGRRACGQVWRMAAHSNPRSWPASTC